MPTRASRQADLNRPWFLHALARRPALGAGARRHPAPPGCADPRRRLRSRLVHASRWPRHIRQPRSSVSTSTRRRSRWPDATPPPSTDQRSGCSSGSPTPAPSPARTPATTPPSPSSASTTCRARSRFWPRSAGPFAPDGDGGGHGRGGRGGVHRPGRRSRAVDVRVQPVRLPARRHVVRAVGRHRDGDAAVDVEAVRQSRPASPESRSCRSTTSGSSASTRCAEEHRPPDVARGSPGCSRCIRRSWEEIERGAGVGLRVTPRPRVESNHRPTD